jgi:hypothetical protein
MNRLNQVINGKWSASPVEGILAAIALRTAEEQNSLARARDLDADEVGRRADALARSGRGITTHRANPGAPFSDR